VGGARPDDGRSNDPTARSAGTSLVSSYRRRGGNDVRVGEMKRTIRDYDDDDEEEEENEAAVGGDGQARGEAGWTARSRRHGLSAVAWSGAAVAVADDDATPRCTTYRRLVLGEQPDTALVNIYIFIHR